MVNKADVVPQGRNPLGWEAFLRIIIVSMSLSVDISLHKRECTFSLSLSLSQLGLCSLYLLLHCWSLSIHNVVWIFLHVGSFMYQLSVACQTTTESKRCRVEVAGVDASWLVSLDVCGSSGCQLNADGLRCPRQRRHLSQQRPQDLLTAMAKAQEQEWKLLSLFPASACVVSATKSHDWGQWQTECETTPRCRGQDHVHREERWHRAFNVTHPHPPP